MSEPNVGSSVAPVLESSILSAAPPLPVVEEYKVIMENAASLSNRRQTVNNVFVSINSIFLSGLGFVFVSSEMKMWTLVLSTVAIAVAVSPVNFAWRHSLSLYAHLLGTHYACLERLESQYAFVGKINTLLSRKRSTTATEIRLATYFLLLYPLIAIATGVIAYLGSARVIVPFSLQ